MVPVDDDFIIDSFNLYGLRELFPGGFRELLDLVKGPAPRTDAEGLRFPLYPRARALLGLIHARFILTARGLTLMVRGGGREGRAQRGGPPSTRGQEAALLTAPAPLFHTPPPPPCCSPRRRPSATRTATLAAARAPRAPPAPCCPWARPS